jgi:hypothetical protein
VKQVSKIMLSNTCLWQKFDPMTMSIANNDPTDTSPTMVGPTPHPQQYQGSTFFHCFFAEFSDNIKSSTVSRAFWPCPGRRVRSCGDRTPSSGMISRQRSTTNQPQTNMSECLITGRCSPVRGMHQHWQ